MRNIRIGSAMMAALAGAALAGSGLPKSAEARALHHEIFNPELKTRRVARQRRQDLATFKQKPIQRFVPKPKGRGRKLREAGLGGFSARAAWYQAHPGANHHNLLAAA